MQITLGMGIGIGDRVPDQGEGPEPGTLTVVDFAHDDNVFDSGAAFGRNAASLPLRGRADPDALVQARLVHAATGAPHTGWSTIAQADAGGDWAGSAAAPRAPHWLRVQVRLQANPAVTAEMTPRCAVGHVIGLMGQSELARTFNNVASGRTYKGVLTNPEQVQMVNANVTYIGGGSINVGIDTHVNERAFVYDGAGWSIVNQPSCMSHVADMVQKSGSADKFMFIDMAISGTGRVFLGDDSDIRRRWSDMVSNLDLAGYQDGVRPGLIVDMWTNEDEKYALNFATTFRPFYTGKLDGGGTYALGDPVATVEFPSLAAASVVFDHCLFDLTGGGRGLFDKDETRITLCHHRYDPLEDRKNWLLYADGSGLSATSWGQEMLRATFRTLPSDPDFGQIMAQGTEPLNYENGFSPTEGVWGDMIHPGQGPDGLELFARHLGHAALRGLGVVPATVPEFDTAVFDPAGAYVDVSSVAGDITTTRRLRGLAEPVTPPGAHWTDVIGFEFNDTPVERAEIQPSGAVRVYVPAARAPADWSRDRFFFGRGGGSGLLLKTADQLAGGWLNYPVVDAASLGIPGMDDDEYGLPGGVAVRPLTPDSVLAPAAYRAAAVTIPPDVFFEDPATIGAGVTQLRVDLRIAQLGVVTETYLASVEAQIKLTVNKALQGRFAFWAGGGAGIANQIRMTPGVRHDVVAMVDMVANTATVTIDGAPWITHTILGGQDAINSVRTIGLLGHSITGGAAGPGFELEYARIWKNDNAGVGTPHKALLASDGVAALNADGWKRGSGSVF